MATAEPSSVAPLRQATDPGASRRSWVSRLSAGHVVMLVAALAAFLVNFSLLRAGDATVPVAVAGEDIRAGQAVTPAAFDFAEVVADEAVLGALLSPERVRAIDGHIADRPISAGEPVRGTDLRPPGAPAEQRAMSVPVGREHAAGGAIAAGDRIDVISVVDGQAVYVVTAAEVLAVSEAAGSGVLAGGGFSVTIAIDAETALRLAVAIRGEAIEVVRSTGAPTARAGDAYTGGAAATASAAGG